MTKKYPTLSDAEEAFDIDYIVHKDENVSGKSPITPSNTMVINDNLSPMFKTTSLEKSSLSSRSVGGIVQEFITTFMHTMSHILKKQLVHHITYISFWSLNWVACRYTSLFKRISLM